jgi:ABC-type transport system substrate-binding protein
MNMKPFTYDGAKMFMIIGVLAIALMIVLAACASEDEPEAPSQPAPAAPAPATAAPAPAQPATTMQETAKSEMDSGLTDETLTLLVANVGATGGWDPTRSGGAEFMKVTRYYNCTLVGGAGGGTLTRGVADSWSVSSDGKTIDFVIADGIKAHDGSDIDIEDAWWRFEFAFGEEALKRPGVDPTSIGLAQVTESIQKIDGNTLRMVFTNPRPDTPFLNSENSQGEDGQIFNADHWKEVTGYNAAGGDISQTDDQAYQNNPDSCGSMKFADQIPGQKFELERFDDYFYQPANGYDEDRRPKFAKYITEVVPEAATRIAGLQAGQADMIEANVFLLEDIEAAGGQVVYQPEAAYSWIVYVDCWDPELWCYDKRVRQALEYAIDKEAIIDSLYNRDMAIPKGWQHVTPSTIGYREGVADPRPYDLEKAKQLLEEAGVDIPPFDIWTWEAGDLPLQPQLAEVFSTTWNNDLGLETKVRTGDATSVRQQWNERKLPGSVLVRTNETRWNGLSITRGMYTYAAGAKAWRTCDPEWTSDAHPNGDPVCQRLGDLVTEKLVNEVTVDAWETNFPVVYSELREENHAFSPFFVNLPWGMGPRIKPGSWKPWPVVTYNTAMWTIEFNEN